MTDPWAMISPKDRSAILAAARPGLPSLSQEDAIGRVGCWAPGTYYCKCFRCNREFIGDKRAISCLPCEIRSMAEANAQAYGAIQDALRLCQHSAEQWNCMSPELRDFKLKIFETLELRCLNLRPLAATRQTEEPCSGDDASPQAESQPDTSNIEAGHGR